MNVVFASIKSQEMPQCIVANSPREETSRGLTVASLPTADRLRQMEVQSVERDEEREEAIEGIFQPIQIVVMCLL